MAMLLADGIPEPNYGCGLTDISCHVNESFARLMVGFIGGLGNFIADMVRNAFTGSTIDAASWKVADGQFWFWATVVGAIVVFLLCIQIGAAAILQDSQRFIRAAVGGLIAVPFASFCVQMMKKLIQFADAATNDVTTSMQGGSVSGSLLRLIGIQPVADAEDQVMSTGNWARHGVITELASGSNTLKGAAAVGQIVIALLIVGLMAVAALVLYMLMELRNLGLIALAAMAPIALMFIGQAALVAWTKRWIQLTVGLILAKPLAAGVIAVLTGVAGSTANIGLFIVAACAVFVAALSPLWAVGLVSFAGADVSGAMARRPSFTQNTNRVQSAARVAGALIPGKK